MENVKNILLSTKFFIDTEYLDKYIDLINNNRNQPHIKFETAKHHIIPRFIFKYMKKPIDNSKDNLVNLYHWQHLLAHYYLAKSCASENALQASRCALIFIYGKYDFESISESLFIDNQKEIQEYVTESRKIQVEAPHRAYRNKSAEEKSKIFEKRRESLSNLVTVNKDDVELKVHKEDLEMYLNQGYVKGRSLRSKKSISKSKLGNIPWNKGLKNPVEINEETRKRLSEKSLGHPVSEEARLKIAKKNSGKIYISKENVSKTIYPEELPSYLKEGWEVGNIKNKLGHLNKKIVNNGSVSITIDKEDYEKYIEAGWYPGHHKPSKNKGRISPTKGKIRITNGTDTRYIDAEDLSNYPEWYRYKGMKDRNKDHE